MPGTICHILDVSSRHPEGRHVEEERPDDSIRIQARSEGPDPSNVSSPRSLLNLTFLSWYNRSPIS